MKMNPYSDSSSYFNDREPKVDPVKWFIWSVVGIFAFILILVAYHNTVSYEQRWVGGVVIEHNVTADKWGDRTYSTIIRTDDGMIDEVIGLGAYTAPKGGRVRVKVRREKNK